MPTSPPAPPQESYAPPARTAGELGVLLAGWLVVCGLNLWWLSRQQAPLPWDQAHHFLLALDYKRALASPLTWTNIFSVAIKYPYLFHLSLAFQFLIFGVSVPLAAGVNCLWLLVLMLAVWRLARGLAGPWLALAAAWFLALLPLTAGLSREVLLELCLGATVALGVGALAASQGLSRRRGVLALGLAVGLGMLAKWTYPLYLAAPFLYTFLWGRRRGLAVDWRGLGWALLILLALALPWYLHSPVTLVKILVGDAWRYGASHGMPPVGSLAAWLIYPEMLVNEAFWLPLSPFLVVGLAWGLGPGRRRGAGLILAWLLGGLVLISLMRNKDMRFLFPLVPAAAILSLAWLSSLPARWLRGLVGGLGLGLALAAYLGSSFGVGPLAGERLVELGGARLVWSAPRAGYSRPPSAADWGVAPLVEALAADWAAHGAGSRPPRVGVLASQVHFHKSGFAAWAAAHGRAMDFVSFLEPEQWRPGQEAADLWQQTAGLDYLIFKTGDLGVEPAYARARELLAPELAQRARLVSQVALPDGSTARLLALGPAAGPATR
ncbi:MAG: glycosyltransferase family 39 protein [Deltaproteobacteria bacterium]|nr:glycosyltransferase family 39 protein [Deltaproteobacteria bacterium]MCB2186344.1 glycosyltransferase family 39 protein [Deltaproteobacteria bacterium]